MIERLGRKLGQIGNGSCSWKTRGRARASGPRADIYSLGVVLYEMVSGERPKMGPGPTQARFKLDSLPERVRDVVARACADAPADRHASAARLREALAAARLGL